MKIITDVYAVKKTTDAYFSGFFVSFEVNFPFSEIQQSLFFPSPAIKYSESRIETLSMANSLRINPYNVKNDILSVQTYISGYFESSHCYIIYLKWLKKIYKNLWMYFQVCRLNVCTLLKKNKIKYKEWRTFRNYEKFSWIKIDRIQKYLRLNERVNKELFDASPSYDTKPILLSRESHAFRISCMCTTCRIFETIPRYLSLKSGICH